MASRGFVGVLQGFCRDSERVMLGFCKGSVEVLKEFCRGSVLTSISAITFYMTTNSTSVAYFVCISVLVIIRSSVNVGTLRWFLCRG